MPQQAQRPEAKSREGQGPEAGFCTLLAGWAQAYASFIKGLDGWKRAAIAAAAGIVSVASLAPFFIWPVMFLTLPVIVWLIDAASNAPRQSRSEATQTYDFSLATRRAFSAGWWFGFGYFAAGLFWVGEAFLVEADKFAWLLPLAVTLLPAGLALFFGLGSAIAQKFWTPGPARVLTLAVTLGVTEWLRGHVLTGFPWNVLGYTLTSTDALMQSAALFGTYSLSLWAVMIFAAPLVLLAAQPAGSTPRAALARSLGVAAIPLVLAGGYGYWRFAQNTAPDVAGVNLRIVQPSIPQREKWLPEKQGEIFQLHLAMSRQGPTGEADDLKGITHLIWPEAAMPFRPLDHPEALASISKLVGTSAYLFSGGLRVTANQADAGLAGPHRPDAYNSLMVFGPGGGLSALYDKIHLVPFGEYLPWQATLEAIGLQQLTNMRGGFSSGASPRQLIQVAGLPPATVLICYEAIFPGEVVQSENRPGLIINVTNDGWFGNTTGPRQHFHQSRVRAVEEGVPLIRVANNGISAVVDSMGRTRDVLGMNVRGVIDSGLPAAQEGGTPYGRLGNLLFLLHVVIFACAAGVLGRR